MRENREKGLSFTSSMPAKGHATGWRSPGNPDGEEGDEEAGKVGQHVSSISHDGQTMRVVTTWKHRKGSGNGSGNGSSKGAREGHRGYRNR